MNKNTYLLAIGVSIAALATLYGQKAYGQTAQPPAAAPQYALAQTSFTSISDRIISDPLYLPLGGQIYGQSAYSYGQQPSSDYTYLGAKTRSVTGHDNTLSQDLAYGITDDLSAHASDAYEFNQNDSSSSATGVATDANSHGFVDPTFGVTWRAFDQAYHSPLDVDLTVNYTPNTISADNAGGGRDGTVAGGRQSAEFLAAVGQEMRDFTVEAFGSATYLGHRSYGSYASGDSFSQAHSANYGFGVNTQTRFGGPFSFNAGLGYNFVDDAAIYNDTTGTRWTAKGANYFDATAALNYQIVPNQFVVGLTYAYDNYADSGSYYAVPTSDVIVKDHYSNVFGVRFQYAY